MLSISPNKVLNPPGHNSTRKSKPLIDYIISTQVLKLFEHDLVYYDDISDHDAPFCNPQISPVTIKQTNLENNQQNTTPQFLNCESQSRRSQQLLQPDCYPNNGKRSRKSHWCVSSDTPRTTTNIWSTGSHDDVMKAIKSLRSDRLIGYDNNPVKFVRPVADYLASLMTDIINNCIKTWKDTTFRM